VPQLNRSERPKRETGAHVHAPLKIATLFVATFAFAGLLIAYPNSLPPAKPAAQVPVARDMLIPTVLERSVGGSTVSSLAVSITPRGRLGSRVTIHRG
jgi:hypothetical protein